MAEYNIGDLAYGSFGKYGRIDVRQGTVVKVTPSGQLVIDFKEVWGGNSQARTRRFNPKGWETGCGQYDGGRLIDTETFERLSEQQALQSGLSKANAECGRARVSSLEDLQALIAKLSEIEAEIERLTKGCLRHE